MKFVIKVVLTAVLAFLLQMFMPWWSIAIAAMAVELAMGAPKGYAFLSGFVGIFILWLIKAYLMDAQNEHILSSKVAKVLPLGGSVALLLVVTALIGGLVGALGAATGREIKRAIAK